MDEEDKGRAKLERREERLLGLDSAQVVDAAKVAEIDSTWRVYHKEWLFDSRFAKEHDAEEHARSFDGRLQFGDLRVRFEKGSARPWVIDTRIWNVHSEWKAKHLASLAAEKLHTGAIEVVARNSRREHQLKMYGITKLPKT